MGRKERRSYLFILTIAMYVIFGLVTSVIGVIIDKFQVQYDVSLKVAALRPFAFYPSYGKQYLHRLGLSFDTGNGQSDCKALNFGIRKITNELKKIGND